MPYDPTRRVPVVHVCTKEAEIAHLKAYEAQQNGAVKDLAKSYRDLDEKMDTVLERIPSDLHKRLRRVEGDTDRRNGASSMLKWVFGLVGVGTLLAAYNFLAENIPRLVVGESVQGSSESVVLLLIAASILPVFAYLTRR